MRTHYTKSEGVAIAYQVLSDNGPMLLQVSGAIPNLALENCHPAIARAYERLGRFSRLINFDKRGTGLSDHVQGITTIEQLLVDIDAVLDASGTDRAVLCGLSQGASLALLYAVTKPERVSHLILVDGICCDAFDPYQPMSDENQLFPWPEALPALEEDADVYANGVAWVTIPHASVQEQERLAEFIRATTSPAAGRNILKGARGIDLRSALSGVSAPTLVLHARNDMAVSSQHGRYFAEHIPGARHVELDTAAHIPWFDEPATIQAIAAIEELLTGTASQTAERVLVTVLFTDIVDSTAQQRTRGDDAWRTLRQVFEANTQLHVEQFGGRVLQFTGDGVMAKFSTPGDGIRAARALGAGARELGIDIRAGLHTGEAYQFGDALSGTCVNIAARVSAYAGPGEICTTDVVRGLVEGSGFAFTDLGEVDLKGIGPRRLVRLA